MPFLMVFFDYKELSTTPEMEGAIQLNETDKLQIVTDVAEAVAFLHNLNPVKCKIYQNYNSQKIFRLTNLYLFSSRAFMRKGTLEITFFVRPSVRKF